MLCKQNTIKQLVVALILLAAAGMADLAFAQVKQEIPVEAEKPAGQVHSHKRATILAACIPGAGQAYNRKYWKIPIAYVGYAGAGFALVYNQTNYKQSKNNYLALTDTLEETVYEGDRSAEMLLSDINSFRRYRDLSALALLAWHGLTIIDANVDAHFFSWDVGEDLSFDLIPHPFWLGRRSPGLGLMVVLNLK